VTDHDRSRALEYAKTAVELDDKDSFAHMALGRAYHWVGSRADAVDALERAVRINPSSAHAHNLLGTAMYFAGRAEEAIAPMLLSVRLSPSDPEIGIYYSRMAGAHYCLMDYDRTIEWARKSLQRGSYWPPHAYMTASFLRLDRRDEAIEARKALETAQPGITVGFVSRSFFAHHPSVKDILLGLRKAGLPE
jgi:tetratricopeptide (TPR) repeat protein